MKPAVAGRHLRGRKVIVAGLVAALGCLAVPSLAAAGTPVGTITRAVADPGWERGKLAGSVRCVGCPGPSSTPDWTPMVFVQPSLPSYACDGDQWLDSDPNTKQVWSPGRQTSTAPVTFDLHDVPLLRGVHGQRVCVLVLHDHRYQEPVCLRQAEILGLPPSSCPYVDHWVAETAASATFTVEQPAPQPPLPEPRTPPVNPDVEQAPEPKPLTMATARARAKRALSRQLGKRWRQGTRRRVRCEVITATVIECRARWRYRERRQMRRVLVSKDDGTVKARVRSG